MNQRKASGCLPGVPEVFAQERNSSSENLNLTDGSKGRTPALNPMERIRQLESVVARLSGELESLKADLREKAKDVEELWTNSDLHFLNAKNLQNAIKARLSTPGKGPVMVDRIDRIAARLKQQGNAWLAKRDLHGWLNLKSRQLAHVLYKICMADGRFETVKKGKYVYLRLKPLSAT
jgi:hypothetical protein